MFCRIEVEDANSKKRQALFVSFPGRDSGDEKLFLTNGFDMWIGVLSTHFYSNALDIPALDQLREDLGSPPEIYVFTLSADLLMVKLQLGNNGLKRRAEISLSPVTSEADRKRLLAGALDAELVSHRVAQEAIERLEKQRGELQAKVTQFSHQLLSKAADREAASADLMRRFLPILNAKKDKIRELSEKVERLEASGSELIVDPADRAVESDKEDEQREEVLNPAGNKRVKQDDEVVKKPAAKKRSGSQKTKTEEEESRELPPGWHRTTSRSKPGQVAYQHTNGRRQFTFPSSSSETSAKAKEEDEEKIIPEAKKQGDQDSFLDEFF